MTLLTTTASSISFKSMVNKLPCDILENSQIKKMLTL